MPWFCLRMHAPYRCRHAGVCCRADWEIPAETHVLTAVDTPRLRSSEAGRALMAGLDHGVELQVPRGPDRACLFYELSPSGSCAIHREAGEDAIPSACRHFPRELVLDPRRTCVSLSHYCPTAAALLTTPSALDIVEAQHPLRIGGTIDGLDARETLPPLVRPGLLTDPDGYVAWESACLTVLARPEVTASEALDRIEALTERVRRWSPADGPLSAAVTRAQTYPRLPRPRGQTELRPGSDPAQTWVRPSSDLNRSEVEAGSDPGLAQVEAGSDPRGRRLANDFAALVAQHVPEEWFPFADYEEEWAALVEGSPEVELVMKNYLGARVFANWVAYQGLGLRTIVEWLRTCHAVVRNEMVAQCMGERRPATAEDAVAAARRADLLMVHTVDSQKFADFFEASEHDD